MSRVSKDIAQKGSEDRCEHMYLVDLSGELESYYETNGETDSVGIDFWKYAKEHKDKQFAFIHNHNTANAFSITDLETPITTDNILYQIVVRDDGVKYIAERVKMAPKGYYPDEYYADKLAELNIKSRNNEITPYERANERERIIIESMQNEFYKVGVLNERK